MKKIIFIFFYLLYCTFSISAQVIKGRVVDAENNHPVSFAVIGVLNTSKGISADIDGRFEWKMDSTFSQLVIQAIGYEKKEVNLKIVNASTPLIISLRASAFKLEEVTVFSKENPANAIIRAVIANKQKYNPSQQKYYICKSYSKTYFAPSDQLGNENFYQEDTARFKEERKIFDRNYLFLVESFSERKYKYKNISQEKIIASRTSGFKTAPFASLATQLQSFTFYDDNIEVLSIKYVNPLMKGTFSRYRFLIEDTIINEKDTTILIKFMPKEKSNFKALKGVLYIYKNAYVLSNVIAEPAIMDKKDNRVKIQQLYAKVDSVRWFPKQLNAELIFGTVELGGKNTKATNSKAVLKCVSKTYIDAIVFDTIFKIKNKNVTVLTQKGYEKQEDVQWDKYRTDSLTQKERNTYQVLDSIGNELKLDRKIALYKVLLSGKIPLGYFDLDVNRILKANEYEGIRLGAGLSTSEKLSKWFTLGGFGGYGFRDKQWKYGGYAQLNYLGDIHRFIKMEASHDLIETAGTNFLGKNTSGLVSTERIRDVLVTRMDIESQVKASWQHIFYNSFKTNVYYSVAERQSSSGWLITNNNWDVLSYRQKFVLHETGIQLRWQPREKFLESLGQKVSLGSKWPILYVNVAKGLTQKINDYKGEFDYTKIDLQLDGIWRFTIKGNISYQLQAGKVIGDVPYTLRYNMKGTRSQNNRVSVDKTFETVFLNEFISDEYAAIFLSYNTGKLFRPNKYSNPTFEICHHYGIGNFNNKGGRLTYVELNDMSKGFTEVGLRVKNIYKSGFSSFGAGVFYRYGNYAYEETKQNLILKLVIGFDLD
jgi:hypothetical protein